MRGHIKKRAKHSYSVVIDLGYDEYGKRRRQWVTVKGTKRDAERRLAELLHQLDTGTFMKPGKTTVAEYLERWLQDYARPNLSPRTAEVYSYIIERHVSPVLGRLSLTQLKPEHLQRYYADKQAASLSPQTIRHHHTLLHKVLKTATEWGLLLRNPVDAVSPPRVHRAEVQFWTAVEVARFLEVISDSLYYPVFYLALYTGMRRSELLGLRWSDVDLFLGQLSIDRGLHVVRGGDVIFTQPKSTKSRRTVALSPATVLMLRDHKKEVQQRYNLFGVVLTDQDFVFAHMDGTPLLPNSVSHAWIRLVRIAGVKPISFHGARHTHASLMLKQGIHPKVVQERLGHSTIAITLDTYSHVAPGLQETAARRFDEALDAAYNEGVVETVG